MGRFIPIELTTVVAEKAQPKVTGGKGYYNGKQCWQYKVVYDRPGTYTFTVPSGTICARTVVVGGGGKPKCISINKDGTTCNSSAGAGGAYSDKCHAVTGGSTAFTVVVGRQEQESTVACNSTPVHTAGGAAGMTPGVASGGDWNSRGGCPGWTCNYCGGSYTHYCGSCKYLNITTCCGYCIVYQYDPAGTTSNCCNILTAGGASAGSPRALCGGCSSIICGYLHSGVAGGGAGIGQQCNGLIWHYACCTCMCPAGLQGYPGDLCFNYPQSAQGGGGSKAVDCHNCRSYQGCCLSGIFKGGDGGPGSADSREGCAWTWEYGYMAFCVFPYGVRCNPDYCFQPAVYSPTTQDWWDISDICGSGAPGTVMQTTAFQCGYMPGTWGSRPKNAGEGAATGGIAYYCCDPVQMGTGISSTGPGGGPLINWQKICQLGLCGQCDQAYLMQDALFPFFITCAGTLGGSGGVNLCGYTSKAGKGGGGGQSKCQLLCVCYGGAFNCCNGVAATPLAFPPCILDELTSNAGTGMAIIYYREA